jgi:hypothetical protein
MSPDAEGNGDRGSPVRGVVFCGPACFVVGSRVKTPENELRKALNSASPNMFLGEYHVKFVAIVILALITLAIALPMMSAMLPTVAAAGTTCGGKGSSCAGGGGDDTETHPGWHGSAKFGDTKNHDPDYCKSRNGCGT